MAANSSMILTNLDFDTLKNTFKAWLRTQDRFADYDFDGSNMTVMMELLAYNTYLQSFYLNMIGNEMFLDTAQIKDSVVSHAKELNYTPRSFNSAVATVNLTLVGTDISQRSVTVPKGTTFSSRIGDKSFTFSTDQNIVINDQSVSGSTITFTGSDIDIYEGIYITDSYTALAGQNNRYIISNKTVDISSIGVTVIEDLGGTIHYYRRASSLFGLDAGSKVFFIQGAPNDQYEIVFGDGVIGRPPLNNSIIMIEYRTSSGELPNGAFQFTADNSIDGIANVTVSTVTRATSGSVSESIESIRYNAPRHFTTQERAITTEDYETLMKANFPEINAVTAYGGENANPPQYGKVFVSVDLTAVDGLPTAKADQYYKFLKPRSPVSIDPVFVSPDQIYVYVETIVRYNINLTNLNADDIKTLATSAILNYSDTYLNNFNRTLRYSKLVNSIDNAHPAMISNETIVKAVKYITPRAGRYENITIDYSMALSPRSPKDISIYASSDEHAVESTEITYNGQSAYLEDDGKGIMRVVSTLGHDTIADVGTVDYAKGRVQLINFKVDGYAGTVIKLYATPKSSDISAAQNTILNIVDQDISITVEQMRE
jgi:hypothetical protein